MVEPTTGPIAGLVLTVVIWTAAVVLFTSMAAAGRREHTPPDEWGQA